MATRWGAGATAILFVLAGLCHSRAAASPETREIAIVATGDLNGWITRTVLDPHDARGLAHLAPAIAKLRERYPDLILLDGGDGLAGSAEAARLSAKPGGLSEQPGPPEPLAPVRVMNALRYDAAVLGNREFGLPAALLRASLGAAKFPFLAGNLSVTPGMGAFADSALAGALVIERGGLRIGVLGLTTPGTPMWVPPSRLRGLVFADLETTAARLLPELRAKADLVVGLFHSGLDGDYDRDEALSLGLPLPNAAGRIADKLGGFDLIVSAGAHHLSPLRAVGFDSQYGVPTVEPGNRGGGLVLTVFTMERRDGRWMKAGLERRAVLAETVPDASILALARDTLSADKAWLDAPASTRLLRYPKPREFNDCSGELQHQALLRYVALRTSAPPHKSGEGSVVPARKANPESLGNKTPPLLRERGPGGEVPMGGADFTLLPMLWRPDNPRPEALGGPIRRGDLFRWMPYEDEPVRAELTGRQMALLLEPYVRLRRKLRVFPGDVLYPGGLTPFWKALGGEAYALAIGSWHNSGDDPPAEAPLLDPHARYPVWITSYVAAGGEGLAPRALLHPSQLGETLPITLREAVFELLSDPNAELPKVCRRWMGISSANR
jgi:2',3'-cyclic-nucleotide 2'-phosphodiesterase (5'-nucleotidase family)